MTRFRHLFTVVIDGAHTPVSANTRNVSSFDVGSMIRPNTNALNASSPSWSNPSWSYTPANASHSSNEAVPSTSGSSPAGPVGPVSDSSSHGSCSCPACRRTRATSTRTARSASVCADPMCSIPNTRRPRLCMICTAVAPEAVVTRRTNEPIRPDYRPREPQLVPPARTKPLPTATRNPETTTESQLRSGSAG